MAPPSWGRRDGRGGSERHGRHLGSQTESYGHCVVLPKPEQNSRPHGLCWGLTWSGRVCLPLTWARSPSESPQWGHGECEGEGCPWQWPGTPRRFCMPSTSRGWGSLSAARPGLAPNSDRKEGRRVGGRLSTHLRFAPKAWRGARGTERPKGRGLRPSSLDKPGQKFSICSRGSGACPSSVHHAVCLSASPTLPPAA